MMLKKKSSIKSKKIISQIGGNRWIDHVKQVKSQNKNLSYKEVLMKGVS